MGEVSQGKFRKGMPSNGKEVLETSVSLDKQ